MATWNGARRSEGDEDVAGFATLDDRGRIALSKAARQALRLRAGSAVAYAVVDGAMIIVPQDEHLARLAEHASQVLQEAGVTVDDLLADLPSVREEILREEYGDEFVAALARAHAALHSGRA